MCLAGMPHSLPLTQYDLMDRQHDCEQRAAYTMSLTVSRHVMGGTCSTHAHLSPSPISSNMSKPTMPRSMSPRRSLRTTSDARWNHTSREGIWTVCEVAMCEGRWTREYVWLGDDLVWCMWTSRAGNDGEVLPSMQALLAESLTHGGFY